MSSKSPDEMSKEEADRRRDAVAKTMLKTPPKPHKAAKGKPSKKR